MHIQFEKYGNIRTILYDQEDFTRYNLPCLQQYCGATRERWADNPHCYKYEADGVTVNAAAEACWRQRDPTTGETIDNPVKTAASTDTDRAIRDYDNGLWHHLVLTTRPDGQKGYNQYLDGVLRAASPFVQGVGVDKGYDDPSYVNHLGVGGRPIDPVGDIRLCGRKKPATWANDDADSDEAEYDPRRYFRGKVAHFSVWNSALSQEQVNDLHKSYVDKYHLTVTPFEMPANIPTPMAYYFMDEGHGRSLKESVTQDSTAGQVLFVDETEEDVNHDDTERYTHQYNQTNKPNWVHDEYFGRTIQCGEITEHSHQKDFLALADVDYGAKGKWAMSVWYRHVNFNTGRCGCEQRGVTFCNYDGGAAIGTCEKCRDIPGGDLSGCSNWGLPAAGAADCRKWCGEPFDVNFQGYQREQFFGHGDPVFPTSARNQVHIQFEKDDGILAIIKDSKDHDRYTIPCMKEWCPSEAYVKEHPNCAWEFPNEERNEVPRAGQNSP